VHEFLDSFDVRRQLGSILVRDGNMVGLMSILRPREAGRFSDEEVRRFELLCRISSGASPFISGSGRRRP
jgi:hypothetical protein